MMILFAFMEISNTIITLITSLRCILDTIFVKHLWFVNRFFNTSNIQMDNNIGTLTSLHELILFEK